VAALSLCSAVSTPGVRSSMGMIEGAKSPRPYIQAVAACAEVVMPTKSEHAGVYAEVCCGARVNKISGFP
jgi:hypothetical protein